MQMTSSPNQRSVSTWVSRVGVFLRERYPLSPVITALFFHSLLSLGFMTSLLTKQNPDQSISWTLLLVQSASVPIFYLLIRIADELKDEEADKTLFPTRPLARGAVTSSDLKIFGRILLGVVIFLHVAFVREPLTLALFAIVLGFIFLMLKWFFMESVIRPSLPLALVTHNPSAFLISLYLMSTWLVRPEIRTNVVCFSLGAWAFAAAWEIGRKIRRPSDETAYTTYSKIWGPRVSALLVVLLLTVGVALQLSVFAKHTRELHGWTSPLWAIILVLACLAVSTFQALRFCKNLELKPPADPTMAVGLSMILFFAWSWLFQAGILA